MDRSTETSTISRFRPCSTKPSAQIFLRVAHGGRGVTPLHHDADFQFVATYFQVHFNFAEMFRMKLEANRAGLFSALTGCDWTAGIADLMLSAICCEGVLSLTVLRRYRHRPVLAGGSCGCGLSSGLSDVPCSTLAVGLGFGPGSSTEWHNRTGGIFLLARHDVTLLVCTVPRCSHLRPTPFTSP